MRDWLIRRLGGYPDTLAALDAIKSGEPGKHAAYIEYLGGFPTWQAALEHVRTQPLPARHAWFTLAVKRLFNTIGPEDVLREKDGVWFHKGRTLQAAQVSLLKIEAKALSESFFWATLQAELLYQANRATYTQAEDIPDIIAGKMLVYYVDIVKSRLSEMLK